MGTTVEVLGGDPKCSNAGEPRPSCTVFTSAPVRLDGGWMLMR
jgi:hypothetical protein